MSRHAYDAKPFYDQPGLSGGSANQGTQPSDPVGKARIVLTYSRRLTTPENNSGPTSQWTGTEGNGVERQQDPVTTEVSDMQFDGFTSHFVAGLKLADMEVDLGLIEKDAKYDRLAAAFSTVGRGDHCPDGHALPRQDGWNEEARAGSYGRRHSYAREHSEDHGVSEAIRW